MPNYQDDEHLAKAIQHLAAAVRESLGPETTTGYFFDLPKVEENLRQAERHAELVIRPQHRTEAAPAAKKRKGPISP